MPQTCSPGPPSTEVCNGIDDDCNGIVDDVTCPMVPNANGTCSGPSCSYTCSAGYSDCNGNMLTDGCEVNTQSDVNNCGGCNSVCVAGSTCVAGVCKQPNGATCFASQNCQSSNCVDGVCCNTACSGTCQACVASQTGGINGTCANILAGTDPASECPGAQNCNGSGVCL